MTFYAYMLRCADGGYYVGHTDDLDVRLAQHHRGEVEGYTQKRRPVELAWCETFPTRDEAFAAEWRVGGWSRAKKEALIAGDWEKVAHFAKPPARRVSRHAVSTSSTAARDERVGGSTPPDPDQPPPSTAHLEPASSEAETRRRESTPREPDQPPPSTAHLDPASSKADTRRRETEQNPAIVLVRPQLGENIGKAARAMLNFGLTDLRLVAPRDGWPNPAAGPAASGADIVLSRAQVFDSVAEAVHDCPHVFATTVRKRGLVIPVATPEEAARTIRTAPGRSSILFGAERSGLETEEVALAGTIITVPINPEFRSLNLAQAVILVAYEWSKLGDLAMPTLGDEAEPRAPHAHLEGLIGQLDEALDAAGYYYPVDRTPATKNTIRTILTKAGWSTREIQALRGMIRTITHPRQRGRATSESSRRKPGPMDTESGA